MHWHPFLTHFPIALLTASAIGWWLAIIYRKQAFRDLAFWNHLMGLIGAGLAVLSGNLAISGAVEGERAKSLLNTHETLGYIILWWYGLLFVWSYIRAESMGKRETLAFALIFSLSLAAVFITAYVGGQLVYQEGIGVAK